MPAAAETMSCSAMPDLEEAVGMRELEATHAAVRGEVGVQHDEPVVRRGELLEHLSVGGCDVLGASFSRGTATPTPLSGSPCNETGEPPPGGGGSSRCGRSTPRPAAPPWIRASSSSRAAAYASSSGAPACHR